MKRVVSNQSMTFANDSFLADLSQTSEVRFALFEHAPIEERREHFRRCVHQRHIPLTFCKNGVNIPIEMEWTQQTGNQISFSSAPFIFNGVWVKVQGTLNSVSLEGRVRFEKFEQTEPETEYMSKEEVKSLRDHGLPI